MGRDKAWLKARAYTPEQLALARRILEEVQAGSKVADAVRRNPLPEGGYLGKHALIFAYRQLTDCGEWDLDPEMMKRLRMKPMRTLSGVTTVTVLTQPHPRARFEEADLADPAWNALPEAPFDRIFAFATLHHLPGDALRRRVVQAVHDLLAEDGRAVISVWNFLASERLQARVVPWDAIELREQDVEPGDHLMDWRRGGYGLRYVHHFSPEELADLARRCGFAVEETFHSDGEGGKLGLYQVWAPASES